MADTSQKICKCGANVAEFLNDISILEGNLRAVTVEKSDIYIPAFKDSVNSIYTNINKIEDDCSIDASKTKWSYSDIFNKVDKMAIIKDPTKFNEIKPDILTDLSRIRYGVIQKIKDCSKG